MRAVALLPLLLLPTVGHRGLLTLPLPAVVALLLKAAIVLWLLERYHDEEAGLGTV